MNAAKLFAAAVALAAQGCSETPQPAPSGPTVTLSPTNRDANAAAVATFFRRTCLEAGTDVDAFGAALLGSGWRSDQVQFASGAMPIAAWRLDHGELVRSAISLGPEANFIDCELSIDLDVAPSLERIRDTLRPAVAGPSLREISAGPPETRWRWRPDGRLEHELTIRTVSPAAVGNGRAARPGLVLHLAVSEATPSLPPRPENATGNVQ